MYFQFLAFQRNTYSSDKAFQSCFQLGQPHEPTSPWNSLDLIESCVVIQWLWQQVISTIVTFSIKNLGIHS